MAATVTMLADLRFVEPGGKLPLEVGAVLPEPREVVGGQTEADQVSTQPARTEVGLEVSHHQLSHHRLGPGGTSS